MKTLFDDAGIFVALYGGPKDGEIVTIDRPMSYIELPIRRSAVERFFRAITFTSRPAFEVVRYRVLGGWDGRYYAVYSG